MTEPSEIEVRSASLGEGRLELVLGLPPAGLAASSARGPLLEVRCTSGLGEPGAGAASSAVAVTFAGCVAQEDGTYLARVELPSGQPPLVSIALRPGSPQLSLRLPELLAEQLAELFPLDDAAFERRFIRRVQRWGGPMTEHFVARQIAAHFPGSAAYRCAAATVMGFKAVESGEPALLDEAAEALRAAQGWLEGCAVDWHPRRNREHLRPSTLSALWHVELARGNREGFQGALEAVRDAGIGLHNYYTPAFPLTKGLLMLGYVHARTGQTQLAIKTWRRCVEVFRFAVRDADPNRETLFGELAESHRAAHGAVQGLRALRLRPPELLDSALVIAAAARVRGGPAERLRLALEALLGRSAEPSFLVESDGEPLR